MSGLRLHRPRQHHPRQRRGSGFTLLEVLVALAVLAIGLGAVIKVAATSTETITLLRDRTVAGWVAANRINELLLADDWPALGRRSGDTEMVGRRWRWEQRVAATADGGLRRVEVAVSAINSNQVNNSVLVQQLAFIGR